MNETKFSKTIEPKELELFHACRHDYNQWATFGGNTWEHSPGLSLVQAMQIELMRWERNNFGLQPPWTGLLGIFEELGELDEAIDFDDQVDAVGDVLVFASNLLVKYRLGIAPIMGNLKDAPELDPIYMLESMGWASHVMLKSEQKIRGYDDVETIRRDIAVSVYRLLRYLVGTCDDIGIDLQGTYLKIGAKVLGRDWKSNPHNADKVAG